MSGWWKRGLVLALVLMVPLAGGCKKKGPKAGAGSDAAGSGFGEEGLGNSSLERERRGLAPEEGGILGDVRFGYDSADVESDALDVLSRNVEWLRQNQQRYAGMQRAADVSRRPEYSNGTIAPLPAVRPPVAPLPQQPTMRQRLGAPNWMPVSNVPASAVPSWYPTWQQYQNMTNPTGGWNDLGRRGVR